MVPLVAVSGWIRARLPLSVSHVCTAKVPTNSVPRKLAGTDVLARESQVCEVLSPPSGAFCVIRPNAVPPQGRDASFPRTAGAYGGDARRSTLPDGVPFHAGMR